MRSSFRAAFVLASILGVVVTGAACGAFGSDEPSEAPPAPAPDAGTPPAEAAAPADTGAEPDAGCATVERVLEGVADTTWGDGMCAGANTYGDSLYLNLPWTALAFADRAGAPVDFGAVVGARLELTADPNCKDCGGGLPTEPGQMLAFPLRTDWVERWTDGGVSYAGADECRRTAGNPGLGWGSDPNKSATTGTKIAAGIDYDDLAGTGDLTAGATSLSITLKPGAFTKRFPAGTTKVAVLLHRTALMVIAARDNVKGLAPPRLVLTECKR